MNAADSFLALEVIWFDDDMLELRIRAANTQFSGQANVYTALDQPRDFADQIEGFPQSSGDAREYEFGDNNLPGYGGAKIRFTCKDGSGHLLVQATIHMNPADERSVPESATVLLETLPASIDAFVKELRSMQIKVGQTAVLRHET